MKHPILFALYLFGVALLLAAPIGWALVSNEATRAQVFDLTGLDLPDPRSVEYEARYYGIGNVGYTNATFQITRHPERDLVGLCRRMRDHAAARHMNFTTPQSVLGARAPGFVCGIDRYVSGWTEIAELHSDGRLYVQWSS